MRKAIVTGATGFIGVNLVGNLVSHGVEVIAVSRNVDRPGLSGLPGVRVVRRALDEMASLAADLKGEGADAFFHLAWEGNSGPARQDYAMQMRNAIFAADAFRAAEIIGCSRFIGAGTITERIASDILNLPGVTAQNMVYGIAKNAARCVCDFISRKSPVEFLWCTLSNVYGPGNATGNIVSYALNNLLAGITPEFSPGAQPFDLMYIDDCAEALYRLGSAKGFTGECFVGSGSPRLLREYILAIGEAAGSDVSGAIGRRPDDGLRYSKEWFDISRMAEAAGFVPRVGFEEGIKRTVESMRRSLG